MLTTVVISAANKCLDPTVFCRVAVVGNVDAGKSTLLGVLTHGELDNGRGFARQKLFRHKHEMESGRTSSVGNDILGFDQEGQVKFSEVGESFKGVHIRKIIVLPVGIMFLVWLRIIPSPCFVFRLFLCDIADKLSLAFRLFTVFLKFYQRL